MSEGTERLVFTGTVVNGHVKPDSVNATKGRLVKWEGRRVTVVVSRYVKSRSNEQLAFFHGPILDAWSDWCGYDKDEMKRELKRAYLAPRLAVARLTGEEIQEIPSLADLTSEEMSTFLERVLREGRQMGIEFPMDGENARVS